MSNTNKSIREDNGSFTSASAGRREEYAAGYAEGLRLRSEKPRRKPQGANSNRARTFSHLLSQNSYYRENDIVAVFTDKGISSIGAPRHWEAHLLKAA